MPGECKGLWLTESVGRIGRALMCSEYRTVGSDQQRALVGLPSLWARLKEMPPGILKL